MTKARRIQRELNKLHAIARDEQFGSLARTHIEAWRRAAVHHGFTVTRKQGSGTFRVEKAQ